MRSWLILSLATSFIFTVGIATVLTVDRSRFAPLPSVALDPQYAPGMPVPDNSVCSWDYAKGTESYCQKNPSGDDGISFAFDIGTHRITFTAMSSHGLTVGDLITMWGTPIAYAQHGAWGTVYWQDRFTLVRMNPLDPANVAIYLGYGWMAQDVQPWRGFINRQDP